MAYFYEMPSRRRISGETLIVKGFRLTVGVAEDSGGDMVVTNYGMDLAIIPAGRSGPDALYDIFVSQDKRATRSTLTDTICATNNLARPPADMFSVQFDFKLEEARTPIVRDITREVFGVDQLTFATGVAPAVEMASFRPGDQSNAFAFTMPAGRNVGLRLFALKYHSVERACWLMLPLAQNVNGVMVVISHGFGQNHAYYSAKGYANPFSKPLLEDVRDRFILWRWGRQVANARPDMALVMPVRSHAAGGELGPFVGSRGVGASFVTTMLIQAGFASALRSVNVVTFSSGIYDANAFIQSGGHGLSFDRMINQDPANGAWITGANRRQFLSGWTTGGPRPGFEFLPEARWANDPWFDRMKTSLGREYLHTWALPEYTLAMALKM
jgi:hypothetical protein